jgi:serine protease Do
MKHLLFPLLLVLSGFGLASIFFLSVVPAVSGGQTAIPGRQTVVYEDSAITQVAHKAMPSVVTIAITNIPTPEPAVPFSPFSPPSGQPEGQQNIGSGFIVSSDGLVITNKHVVTDTSAGYKVITDDDKQYPVTDIYRDPLNDLAILKVNQSGMSPIQMGDSSKLTLGQLVVAIGTPLGELQNTVTHGIISGLGRGLQAGSPYLGSVEQLNDVIQTDAPINPGNSGGPLLNASGEVIGINTAIAEGGQDIGFSIPVNVAKDLISKFRNTGSNFEQAFIGIRYRMIDSQTAKNNNTQQGAQVIDVVSGSPADKAGIKQADIITSFDGKSLKGSDQNSLSSLVLQKKPGDTVTIDIWRDSQKLTKQVTLTRANQSQ